MNNNLEKEYKDFIESEVSSIDKDALWAKIDAALPEKKEPVKNIIPWYKRSSFISLAGSFVAVLILAFVFTTGAFRPVLDKHESTNEAAAPTDTYYEEAATDSFMEESEPALSSPFESNNFTAAGAKPGVEKVINSEANAERIEESDTCVGLPLIISFTVIEIKADNVYLCVANENYTFLNSGEEFLLETDDKLVVQNTYSFPLSLEADEEIKFFSK